MASDRFGAPTLAGNTDQAYVALLRGINVGGHNRLLMKDLVGVAEACGLTAVRTYIQSGNLVFRTPLSAGEVADALEARLVADTGVTSRIAVRSAADLARTLADNPFLARGVDTTTLHVAFLFAGDRERMVDLDVSRYPPDELAIGEREAYLLAPNGLGRSKLAAKMVGTLRNWRTAHKLLEMAQG